MKLKNMSIEELEAMSYDDIAYMILTETNKKMKTNELFKKVCDLLNLTEDEFVAKLPAFFELLNTDHRFIMIEKGYWDLKTKHSTKIVIDSEEDDDDEVIEEIKEENPEEDQENYYDEDDDDDSDSDDDLKDLVIIDEDDETNGLN